MEQAGSHQLREGISTAPAPRILDILGRFAPRPYRINPRSTRNHYSMACPLPGHERDQQHLDHSGSFSVDETEQLFFCFGCRGSGNAHQLRRILSGPSTYAPARPVTDAPSRAATLTQKQRVPLQGATIDQVASVKGLSADYLRNGLGWRDSDWYGTSAIEIPYRDIHGKEVQVRYRVGIDSDDRFRWAKGSKPMLYGLEQWGRVERCGEVWISAFG